MNTPNEPTLSNELHEVLQTWAHAQKPDRDFSGWRMASFRAAARVGERVFFAPGELALVRRADKLAAGQPAPLALWSFALADELLIHPGLVHMETPELAAPEKDTAHAA